MSQYLSHLANLALNQLDVVQPRLASRFESQGAAVAPSPVHYGASHHEASDQETIHHEAMAQQEVISEAAAPRAAKPIRQSLAPDHIDVRPVDKTPVQPHATTVIPQPKASPSLIAAQTGFQPLPSQAASLQSAQQEKPAPQSEPLQPMLKERKSQASMETELPALQPMNIKVSGGESAKPEFKEEHIETRLPLLTPVKVQRTPRVTPIEDDVQAAESTSRTRYQDDSKEFAVKPRGQELIAALQTPSSQQLVSTSDQNSEQPAKPAAVKPETIRIQPLQPDFSGGVVQSNQPVAAAPVDITPPSIHVSIGRIEIRASQASAPAIAKPRTSSTMSLDDYLKQRGEKP